MEHGGSLNRLRGYPSPRPLPITSLPQKAQCVPSRNTAKAGCHNAPRSRPGCGHRPFPTTIGPVFLLSFPWRSHCKPVSKTVQLVEKNGSVSEKDTQAGPNTRFYPSLTHMSGAGGRLSGLVAGYQGGFNKLERFWEAMKAVGGKRGAGNCGWDLVSSRSSRCGRSGTKLPRNSP